MNRKQGTLNECRKFFPKCTAEKAHALAWGATAFPFAPVGHCREQLRQAAHASGWSIASALAWYEDQVRNAFDQFRQAQQGEGVR